MYNVYICIYNLWYVCDILSVFLLAISTWPSSPCGWPKWPKSVSVHQNREKTPSPTWLKRKDFHPSHACTTTGPPEQNRRDDWVATAIDWFLRPFFGRVFVWSYTAYTHSIRCLWIQINLNPPSVQHVWRSSRHGFKKNNDHKNREYNTKYNLMNMYFNPDIEISNIQ